MLGMKLSNALAQHLDKLDVYPFLDTETPTISRVIETARPHISFIELVSAPEFHIYEQLYTASFAPRTREASALIVDRLSLESSNQRTGLATFRIVGIRDHAGEAIGAAHFSILFLPNLGYAVPYLQYVYVREQNRGKGMLKILHALTLAVTVADASKQGVHKVPFTLFETEPAGYGETEGAREVSTARIRVHTKSGAKALMLESIDFTDRSDDIVMKSPHVQPGLENNEPPISLIWAVRPSPREAEKLPEAEVLESADDVIAAYYQGLRDEGLGEEDIARAEQIVARRRVGRRFVMVPLENITLSKESIACQD